MSLKQKILADQVDYLYKQLPTSLMATVFLASVIAYALSDVVEQRVLYVWMVLNIAVVLLRFAIFQRYAKRRTHHDVRACYRMFAGGALLNALVWGGATFFLFVDDSFIHQILLTFIYAGIVAGAAVSLSARKELTMLYIGGVIFPLMYHYYGSTAAFSGVMPTVLFLFLLFMLFGSLKFSSIIEEGIRVKFENIDLVEKLTLTQQEVEALNIQLSDKLDSTMAEVKRQEKLLFQQSKLVAMGEMIGNIAHQWRQPLNVLALKIQDIEDAYEFGELDAAYIEKMKTSAMKQINYMSKTIDDFRDYLLIDQKVTTFKIAHSVEHAVELLEAALHSNGIECVLTVDTDAEVRGNASEFQQVVMNLLNNSKEAFEEQQSDFRKISIKVFADDAYVYLRCTDNAGGIPEYVIDRVFEPYFTTKDEGKGTGIGLYMSYRIIKEKMQGSIEVHNSHNGAEFLIKIPQLSSERYAADMHGENDKKY